MIKQFDRGVVIQFGRVQLSVREPGLALLTPIADHLEQVNMRIIGIPVPAQHGITGNNVTVRVDAVIYLKVADPVLRGRRMTGINQPAGGPHRHLTRDCETSRQTARHLCWTPGVTSTLGT